MKCPMCGAENDNSAAFCNFCGTALNDTTSGFMDGLDTSNLDLDSQFANSGFGRKNQESAPPPMQQAPQMTNDPYATNNFNNGQGTYGGYGQQVPPQQTYQQPQYQYNYNQPNYGQQQAQATGFRQNNAAFNNAANGFANPAYNGFDAGRAGTGAVRKKSNTGVVIAIVALLAIIGIFGFMALKYSKKAAEEKTVNMRCMSVTLPGSMVKDQSFDESSFLGSYDPSVMNVVTEFYEDSDESAFIYMKISYPSLSSEEMVGMDADLFMNLWLAQMKQKDSAFTDVSKAADEDNCKSRCITYYNGKRMFIFAACRYENNAFYFSMFMCHENDRSTYESKFEKWDRSIKITD